MLNSKEPHGATNLSTLASSGATFIHHFSFASCVLCIAC